MDLDQDQALSKRERQVLALAAEGLTDHGIANALGVTVATVNSYWVRIRSKMGPYPRAELVANAVRDQAIRILDRLSEENDALRAAAELHQRSDPVFRLAFDSLPDAVIVLDAQHRTTLANPAAEKLFGRPSEQLCGTRLSELLTTADGNSNGTHPGHFGAQASVAAGASLAVEYALARIEGDEEGRWVCLLRPLPR